jgi:hypothetical protein
VDGTAPARAHAAARAAARIALFVAAAPGAAAASTLSAEAIVFAAPACARSCARGKWVTGVALIKPWAPVKLVTLYWAATPAGAPGGGLPISGKAVPPELPAAG